MTCLFFDHDFIQSGTILSCDQSPPPMTFPALAILKKILDFALSK